MYIDIAKSIADFILKNKKDSENEMIKWDTWISNEYHNKYDFITKTDLYSGNAGIAFFLLNLFQKTKDHKYLEACQQSCNFIFSSLKTKNSLTPGFYNGDYGQLYILELFNKQLKSEIYLLSDLYKKIDLTKHIKTDVISGHAGCLIVLLELYELNDSKKKKDVFLKLIETHLNKLIEQLKLFKGDYVFRDGFNYPLVGLSHGQSGIAFALNKLRLCFELSIDVKKIVNELYSFEFKNLDSQANEFIDFRPKLYFKALPF